MNKKVFLSPLIPLLLAVNLGNLSYLTSSNSKNKFRRFKNE